VEELPPELKAMFEAYREARRPSIKIGYMRIKRVVGEIYGRQSEDKAEGGHYLHLNYRLLHSYMYLCFNTQGN